MPSEETETLDAPVDTDDTETTEPEAHAEHDELNDGGKKALDAERKARRAAERAAKAAQAEIEKLKEAQLSEAERAVAEARREARAEALAEVNARVLRAEIKAVATGKLTDPADALTFLDPSEFDVSEDGEVDTKSISKAIDDLVKSKPYLAAQRVGGDVDSGARGTTPNPSGDMNLLIRRAAGRV
jgi:membrane protein involved in colicin uptake